MAGYPQYTRARPVQFRSAAHHAPELSPRALLSSGGLTRAWSKVTGKPVTSLRAVGAQDEGYNCSLLHLCLCSFHRRLDRVFLVESWAHIRFTQADLEQELFPNATSRFQRPVLMDDPSSPSVL